jgi:hypothetical protein
LVAPRAGDVGPRALAADEARGYALYEWIDGAPVSRRTPGDIEAMVAFARTLHAARGDAAAASLDLAAEAILAPGDLLAQLDLRLVRLRGLASAEPLLGPLLERIARLQAGLPPLDRDAVPQPLAQRTLSPSDFGTHNALRRADGRLVFLDFEYFGWDDPVKLIVDACWHPGMGLDAGERCALVRGLLTVYAAGDPGLAGRLRVYDPFVGLRWAAIVLNEFVPEVWERRVAAGASDPWPDAKARQAHKAAAILDVVERGGILKGVLPEADTP